MSYINESLFRRLHIEQLTPMQEATREAFARRGDLVLLSPTGSGKTLAYLLPLMEWLQGLSRQSVASAYADGNVEGGKADAAVEVGDLGPAEGSIEGKETDALAGDLKPAEGVKREEGEKPVGVKAVILVPSRELALQTEQVIKQMGFPFKAMSCYGGRPAMEEHRTMKTLQPSIIVGTPGRMNDHLQKRNFDARQVELLVIDEFDKSLELGFQEEMSQVLAQLPALRKRVLLSATEAEEIPAFVGQSFASASEITTASASATAPGSPSSSSSAATSSLTAPATAPGSSASSIAASKSSAASATISASATAINSSATPYLTLNFLDEQPVSQRLSLMQVHSPEKDKLETLFQLLCALRGASTLVFVNYRESVDRIVKYLRSRKFPCDAFHGGMEQPLREKALYKFRNGSCPVLVSTDLAARGLDISHLDNVIHYHLPVNEEAFTHRNGRTARWQSTGSSFLLLHAEEHLPDYIHTEVPLYEIPVGLKVPKPRWTTLYIGKGKRDKVNKVDIVGFLYKKGGLQRDEVGPVDVLDHHAFAAVRQSKTRQLLNLVQGEKLKGMKLLIEEAR